MVKNQFILQELRTKIDQACRTAEEFTKLYYESLDKRRYVSCTNIPHFPTLSDVYFSSLQQLMSRLYMDTAILIWNGNGIEGKDQIQNFWTELPSSDHSVITLDAQPITGKSTFFLFAYYQLDFVLFLLFTFFIFCRTCCS